MSRVMKLCITALVIGLSLSGYSNAANVNYNNQFCSFSVTFDAKPVKKEQTIDLNSKVKLNLGNLIATKVIRGAKVASNVTCQKLTGASYTGSKQEWSNFFDSAISGLVKAKYQDLQFTLVGDDERVYKATKDDGLVAKEYNFMGATQGNQQVIKNLAILDKSNNTLYTFSVSGNVMVEKEVSEEFERLVTSLENVK